MSKFIIVRDLRFGQYGNGKCLVDNTKSRDTALNIEQIVTMFESNIHNGFFEIETATRTLYVSPDDYERIISVIDKAIAEVNKDPTEEPTQNEPIIKTIPRGYIDRKWNWVARDEDGVLFLYENKPKKGKLLWHDNNSGSYYDVSNLMDNELENIHWEDEEPTKIED